MATVRRVPGPAAARFEQALKDLQTDEVGKVGWFESARYENGTPVAQIARIQNDGAPSANIPPRPFFDQTIAAQKAAWAETVRQGAKAVLSGGTDVHGVLEAVSLQAEGDVAKTIAEFTTPALKDSTVRARQSKRRRGFPIGSDTKPLIESSLMITTLTHLVGEE